MSASSKKKLRKEQEAAKMTEKQLTAQKEATKTKLYTTAFVAVMAVILVIAVVVGVKQTITASGIREKNTVALTVGDHELNSVEMNYYFMDAVNNFYSSYGSYASMFGLDMTKPLNEQYVDEEAGLTWADDFMTSASESAAATYALVDAAEAAGYTLPAEQKEALETEMASLELYATMYGYSNADSYLKAMYGNGASKETYTKYYENQILASSYYSNYAESLTYEDADLRAKEAEDFNAYSSFSYNYYYLSANRFLAGGTTDAEGNTTYSDEEKAASVTAAEAAAQSLVTEEITSTEALDAAIAALAINEGTTAASTANTNVRYVSLSNTYSDWVSDSSRKAGDKTVIANVSTSTDEAGNEVQTILGYYVLYFQGRDENQFNLANVRHILISFAHNHDEAADHDHTETTYTDAEKAAAKTAAEEILAQWEAGDKTEDSFAALATENTTDPGSMENGGLYENVYPGQMVTAFNDWCFDESRKTGDTGIVETEYGYHVMYYVGESDISYRDFLITNELRNIEVNEWYAATVEAMTMTDGDTKYIAKDLVLGNG